jgi:hypothetical protein
MNKPIIGIVSSKEEVPKGLFKKTVHQVNLDYINMIYENNGVPLIIPYTDDLSSIDNIINLIDGLVLIGGEDVSSACYKKSKDNPLIRDLFEIDIDYYVRVNFTTLINLVDAIGGIDVYSDAAFTAWTDHNCHYRVGTMHLNGKCALAFARERMAYLEGDRHRVKNQQDIIAAIMKKTLSSSTLINKYTDILESLGDSFQTNFPEKKIYELINIQLSKMPSWKLETNSVNGTDSENGTYTFGSQKLYVMEPDMKTVEDAKVKINKIMKK